MDKVTAEDAGCWVNNARGIHMPSAIIVIAENFGYEISEELKKYIEENNKGVRIPGSRSIIDTYEFINEELDDVDTWMNDHVAPAGFAFGMNPDWGNWGLYEIEEEEVGRRSYANGTLDDYIERMLTAVGNNRKDLQVSYRGREGAMKFAREIGYAFNDFPQSQHTNGMRRTWEIARNLYDGRVPVNQMIWDNEIQSQIEGDAVGRQMAGNKTEKEWIDAIRAMPGGGCWPHDPRSPKENEYLAGWFGAPMNDTASQRDAEQSRNRLVKELRAEGWQTWTEPKSHMGGTDEFVWPFSAMKKGTGQSGVGRELVSKQDKYDVYLRSRLIDSVFYNTGETAASVQKSLINHDGYDPRIVVVKARG